MNSSTCNFHISGVHFKLYLSNCTTDRFEIPSLARLKVAIMIPGFYVLDFSKKQDVLGFHSAGHRHKYNVGHRISNWTIGTITSYCL